MGQTLPEGLRGVIARATSANPAERPQSMHELIAALTPYAR